MTSHTTHYISLSLSLSLSLPLCLSLSMYITACPTRSNELERESELHTWVEPGPMGHM